MASTTERTRARSASRWLAWALALALVAVATGLAGSKRGQSDVERPNLLLLIGDDVGLDLIAAYQSHPEAARTPVIDGLAQRGVRFSNVWSYSSCSPSRAALLTGLPAHRTGIGSPINPRFGRRAVGLDPALPTLPKALRSWGYRSWAFGKWHLSGGDGPKDFDVHHPNKAGFDYFAGSSGNFLGEDYYRWTKIVNGVVHSDHEVYATTDTVDETLAQIRAAEADGSPPWFAWVAFHAVHRPWVAPPDELHSYDLPSTPGPLVARAIVEAMDREIGRLLSSLPAGVLDSTTVVFLSENGTLGAARRPPLDKERGKFTLFEGGLRVPLIVAGPAVPAPSHGRQSDALVHLTDLYATLIELAGGDANSADSISLVPYLADPQLPSLRETLYAEDFKPNGVGVPRSRWGAAVRESRYKLLQREIGGASELYDLQADPLERRNLMKSDRSPEQQAALERLSHALGEAKVHSFVKRGGKGKRAEGAAPVTRAE